MCDVYEVFTGTTEQFYQAVVDSIECNRKTCLAMPGEECSFLTKKGNHSILLIPHRERLGSFGMLEPFEEQGEIMYDYQNERKHIFTEDGLTMLLEIRDKIFSLCKKAGACTMTAVMTSGDSWQQLACVDYLVERGDICKRIGETNLGSHQILIWITDRLN